MFPGGEVAAVGRSRRLSQAAFDTRMLERESGATGDTKKEKNPKQAKQTLVHKDRCPPPRHDIRLA